MKNRGSKLLGIFVLFGGMLLFVSIKSVSTSTDAWVAPSTADNVKNPIKADAASIDRGKKTFKQMCAICHGDKGRGNGMAGASLNPRPSDFTRSSVQAQTDGALYWKLTNGKPPMAAYKNSLKENQRWDLVNYIRTFKRDKK